MLGRRESQGDFFRADHAFRDHVGEETFYGLLARQGADWFRDEDFVALYREDFGRPSVPPSQLAVALLLQAHDGVSDEEAIARSAFDLRWKVALGLELDEKLCAKSTLQRFRAQLILHEATGRIFDRGVEACRAAGLLKRATLSAAIDTTPILGRGAVRDTYNLVSDGIRHVVDEACRFKGSRREETASHSRGALIGLRADSRPSSRRGQGDHEPKGNGPAPPLQEGTRVRQSSGGRSARVCRLPEPLRLPVAGRVGVRAA